MHPPRPMRALCFIALLSLAAAAPATGPANPSPPKTGEIALNFTQRSPLSSRKEIARRLGLKESVLGPDYDLSTYTFRAYVPPNYDPSTPHGLFVFLGSHHPWQQYPAQWEPLFDKSHMIFITLDWHDAMTPIDLMGLGFDAVENLKHLYNIDPHRLYDMWANSGPILMPVASADVYTGMILCGNWRYWRQINLSANSYHPADFAPPPGEFVQKAKLHGVVLISITVNSEGPTLAKALEQDGFSHVLHINVTSGDLTFPNYAVGWITDPVLPFLDKYAQPTHAPPAAQATGAVQATGAAPAAAPSAASPAGNAQAQHLLTMAKLFIANGNPEKARSNLQAILSEYPHDPAAVPAKKLLDTLPEPPPPQ